MSACIGLALLLAAAAGGPAPVAISYFDNNTGKPELDHLAKGLADMLITDLSQRIAIYYAHANVAADKIRTDYETALKQLRDIAGGMIVLDAAGVEPAPSGASEVITNEPERTFTPDSLKGFV